ATISSGHPTVTAAMTSDWASIPFSPTMMQRAPMQLMAKAYNSFCAPAMRMLFPIAAATILTTLDPNAVAWDTPPTPEHRPKASDVLRWYSPTCTGSVIQYPPLSSGNTRLLWYRSVISAVTLGMASGVESI